MTRHLIEVQGFRVFILEESYPHAELLNQFVLTGQGDLRDILNRLAGWYLWDTEEMVELVQWIRDFNEGLPENQKVHFYGMDITAPALGVQSILDSLAAAGVETALDPEKLGLNLQQGDMWPTTWQRYGELSEERLSELGKNYSDLAKCIEEGREALIAFSSIEEFERMELLGEIGILGNKLFSSGDRKAGGVIREQGMTQIVLWVLEHERPGEKAILWGHNLHMAKSSFLAPGFLEGDLEPMGMLMKEELGERYLVIGGTFGSGSYPGNVPPGEREFANVSSDVFDGALAEVGFPNFLIDLRPAQEISDVAGWLHMRRECRAQGMQAMMVPGEAFDMVYFVNEISRSQPTPLALRKYQSPGEPD